MFERYENFRFKGGKNEDGWYKGQLTKVHAGMVTFSWVCRLLQSKMRLADECSASLEGGIEGWLHVDNFDLEV